MSKSVVAVDTANNVALEQRSFLTLGTVPYGTGFQKPFDTIYANAKMVTPQQIRDGAVDALVIWGGADISPTIYGEEPNGSHAGVELSVRDKVEVAVCEAAIEKGIPIIGICRGAQLLCALAGGKLYQDVGGHHGDHTIITDSGEEHITSSIHHQMMDINGLPQNEVKLIAWTKDIRAPEVMGAVEPEIVYFPRIKGLAIQGHPEFMSSRDPFVGYCRDLVNQYLVT
jgi:gamma-glutamyl-gamma-aminobutyrate hydrolase PuuD